MTMQDKTGIVPVSGEYRLSASRARVWHRLQEPAVLQYCIRGCEEVARSADGVYHAVFEVGVGPAKGQLHARLSVLEIDPPDEYGLQAETHLRFLGHAQGSAQVRLTPYDGETMLTYHGEVHVKGWLAHLGDSRLSTAADRAMAHFFERFAEVVV